MQQPKQQQQQPAKKFRTKAKLHFLTYPQCDVPLVEMVTQLQRIAGERYGWLIISAEDHEERENDTNVGVHRHVMQEYNCSSFETINQRYWDIVYQGKTYHPHFEPVKNKSQCLKYVMKDGDFIYDGSYKNAPFSPDTYLEANGKKQGYGFTYMATEIKKGKTMEQLDDVIPGLVLNNKRKIQEYIAFQEEKKQKSIVKPKFYGFERPRGEYAWDLVVEWANKNFMEKRTYKQPQLWLWSRNPDMGKTHPWAVTLRKYFTCYEWIYGSKQCKPILTADYILMDEFRGGITLGELKSLSQMFGMNLDLKYEAITYWDKNVPLIVTANKPPNEVYSKCGSEINSLLTRFLVVEVEEYCELVPNKEPDPEPEPEPQPQPSPDTPVPEDKEDSIIWYFDDKMDQSEEESQPSEETVKRKLRTNLKCSEKLLK